MTIESDSTSGFQSEIFKTLIRIFLSKPGTTPADACWYWNQYVSEAALWVTKFEPPTKIKMENKEKVLRKVFKEVFRGTPHFAFVEFLPSGEVRLKGDTQEPEMVEAPRPEPTPTAPPGLGRPMTEEEVRIAKLKKRPMLALVPAAPPSRQEELEKLNGVLASSVDEPDETAEKMQKATEHQKACLLQVMNTALDEAEDLATKQGSDLFVNAVKVFYWPELNHRAIFFRSSTAPWLGDGVNVKHDFRANDEPVNHKHSLAYKQNNGHKVIRSVTHKRGYHEYYCKALEYEDGMVIKGYFVVDGKEDAAVMAPRYYRIQGDTVVTITEREYNIWLNRRAAR